MDDKDEAYLIWLLVKMSDLNTLGYMSVVGYLGCLGHTSSTTRWQQSCCCLLGNIFIVEDHPVSLAVTKKPLPRWEFWRALRVSVIKHEYSRLQNPRTFDRRQRLIDQFWFDNEEFSFGKLQQVTNLSIFVRWIRGNKNAASSNDCEVDQGVVYLEHVSISWHKLKFMDDKLRAYVVVRLQADRISRLKTIGMQASNQSLDIRLGFMMRNSLWRVLSVDVNLSYVSACFIESHVLSCYSLAYPDHSWYYQTPNSTGRREESRAAHQPWTCLTNKRRCYPIRKRGCLEEASSRTSNNFRSISVKVESLLWLLLKWEEELHCREPWRVYKPKNCARALSHHFTRSSGKEP